MDPSPFHEKDLDDDAEEFNRELGPGITRYAIR